MKRGRTQERIEKGEHKHRKKKNNKQTKKKINRKKTNGIPTKTKWTLESAEQFQPTTTTTSSATKGKKEEREKKKEPIEKMENEKRRYVAAWRVDRWSTTSSIASPQNPVKPSRNSVKIPSTNG